jgi:hypothetical protein
MSHRTIVFFLALLLVLGTGSYAFAGGKPVKKEHVKKTLKKNVKKKIHKQHHGRPR